MIFRSLKMAGFKSFAEAAELDIENGLTGIVGPNGCGKSNIVEGLRWVMGESSARQMRGGEMDDVIFAGTEQRPARNLAEITLELDNRKRSAPAEFNNSDDIEITRKIERGKGSSYYVNAKPARARDIQLLFADVASGARSSGIVSQGRIGAIVGAKPTDRRALLEEAANIRGLHARRHEAELRLRSAESNLERLDDVIAGLIEQRDSLKKQARQAARYRSVADRIRKAEGQLLLASWTAATAELTAADADLKQAKSVVAERTQLAAKSATARAEISASLPPLRQAEAEKASAYQRLSIGREELDREEERLQQAFQQLTDRQAQLTADIARETSLRDDANTAIKQLNDEASQLANDIAEATPRQAETAQNLEVARASATVADAALADASAALRAAANTRATLNNRQNDITARQAAATASLAGLATDELVQRAETAATEQIAVEADFHAVNKALETADTELTTATAAAEAAETARRDSAAQIARLQAEIDALQYLLADQDDGESHPVIDQLSVRDGMETALAAYLADELSLPVGGGRRGYWQSAPQKTELQPPAGTIALADYISGVPALTTALAGVGIDDEVRQMAIPMYKRVMHALDGSLTDQAYGTLYGSVWDRNANGDIYVDANGVPVQATNDSIVGDPNPDWLMGINNNLQIGNLSFSFLWDIRVGGDIWNGTRGALYYFGMHENTALVDDETGVARDETFIFEGVYAPGTVDADGNDISGQANTIPITKDISWYAQGPGSGFTGPSEQFVEDGGWVRLRQLSLNYDFSDMVKNSS